MWFITFDLIKKYNLWFITYDQKHEMYKSTRCTLTKNTRRTLWCHIDLNTMLSICNLSSRNQSNYIWQSQVSIGLWNPPYDSKLNKNIIKRGSSRLSWEMDKTTPPPFHHLSICVKATAQKLFMMVLRMRRHFPEIPLRYDMNN